MNPAGAEGQNAQNARAVHVRMPFGPACHHPVDSEIAEALQRNPDEPKHRGADDSRRGRRLVFGQEPLYSRQAVARHPISQQHVAEQHHKRGNQAYFEQMPDSGPIQWMIDADRVHLNSPFLFALHAGIHLC